MTSAFHIRGFNPSTLAPDAFAALRADGSVHCWGGFFSGGHLGAMRQELYQAGKVMEVLRFKLMNIVEKKNNGRFLNSEIKSNHLSCRYCENPEMKFDDDLD